MGERRPPGDKEFNPLDDSMDLISQVLQTKIAPYSRDPGAVKRERTATIPLREQVVELRTPSEREPVSAEEPSGKVVEGKNREEFVVFKFKVPRSEYIAAKKIASALGEELNARIDLSNLGRGWLTRLITAEKETLDAARQQQKLKTPNSRDPLQIAEIDHVLAVIQSVAFRRAIPVK